MVFLLYNVVFCFLQSISINEFLKPAEGEWPVAAGGRGGRGRGRGRGGGDRGGGGGRGGGDRGGGGRGESRGEFLGRRRQDPAPSFEDPNQFPVLGGAFEA